MSLHRYGITRAQLKHGSQGPGGGNGDDHFDELVGSRALTIYLSPGKKLKGYAELKAYVEDQGCEIGHASDARLLPGKGYEAVKITMKDGLVPETVLRRAHQWAHQRNYLHSFFKPYPTPGGERP